MKIAILASDTELYSHKRLIEVGTSLGHEMRFIDIRQCYMNITASKPLIHYRGGEILDDIDAIIPRIRPALTFYGTAVLRQFEVTGKIYALNDAVSIIRARDKLRSLQLLARKGIEMPVTGFANSPMDTKDLIKMVGGAPLIIKLLESTQGVGVVLAETNKAAESVIQAFKSLKANILVQEFIKEADGRDIRCIVLGEKVIASMQRQAADGSFKSNLHQGGTASSVKISPIERAMAIKATKAMGLEFAGVDLVRSHSGPKVLEVNSSAGLEGIEKATKKNVASMVIQYIEKQVNRGKKARRA